MTWFIVALVGPILYAITNHIDKLLLEKYFKEGGVGTLMLFSALLSAIALPFLFLGDSSILSMNPAFIPVLALVSLLNVGVLWFYLQALKNDEASIVVLFYQLVPVLGFILGYFILGETLTFWQLVAMGIIIFGTSIISFEIDSENNFKLRKMTVLYMLGAVTCWATESVIFKAVALEENVWRALFWEHLMMVIIGILLYLCVKSYRHHFHIALRTNSKRILSLNVLNEGIYTVGNVVVSFAYLMAPISLVLLAESYQPIFVFLIGVTLTLWVPKMIGEKLELRHIIHKLVAILITGLGTFVLLSAT